MARLRRAAGAGRRAGRRQTLSLSRPRGRSVRRAGTADASRRLSRAMPASICWPRSAADGSTDRDALHAALVKAGLRTAPDDNWADLFSRVMVEKIEPMLGQGRATILYEISDLRGGTGPAERRRPARRRALRALLLRRRTRQRLRRTDRRRRAAPALRRRDGRESSASMASAIRSTRISSPRWPSCRRPAARARLRPAGDAGDGGNRIEDVIWTPVAMNGQNSAQPTHRRPSLKPHHRSSRVYGVAANGLSLPAWALCRSGDNCRSAIAQAASGQ